MTGVAVSYTFWYDSTHDCHIVPSIAGYSLLVINAVSSLAWRHVLTAAIVAWNSASAQLDEWDAEMQRPILVKPSATTSGIAADFDRSHFCYGPADDAAESRMDQLVVFLPGTGGAPSAYQGFLQTAAALGFHSIGLSYVNGESMGSYCGDAETGGCFEQARLEVIDGTDRNSDVTVDRANSIENRLLRLLQHLAASRPEDDWGQFFSDEGESVAWSKIVVAGHSQGGGHAGVIALHHKVARVLIFASTDWLNGGRRPADWMSAPSATPKSRYFALGHERDLLIFQNRMLAGMQALGLDAFGEIQAPEAPSGIYFGGTHHLMTNVEPRIPTLLLDAHSAMIVDVYTPLADDDTTPLMQPAWTSMLTAPIAPPVSGITINHSHHLSATVSIRMQRQAGIRYQLQQSTELNTWRDSDVHPIEETESHDFLLWKLPREALTPTLWRVAVFFQ